MRNLYDKFWVKVTIVLSLIYIVLGFPAFLKSHSVAVSILLIVVGVFLIWITYLIRAYFWSDKEMNEEFKGEFHGPG
jgi:membrane-bound ClpP family serine protease